MVTKKYFWPTFCQEVEAFVKGCNICLVLKTVYYKLYRNLQSLSIPTYCWKDLFMDFVTGPLLSIDWKYNSYDTMLVIIDWLIKIVYYKVVKNKIDVLKLAKRTIDVMVRYYSLPELITSKCGLLFTLKFWFYYVTSSVSSVDYLQPFIHKQTAKPRDKTILWRHTSKVLSIESRMIRQNSYL